MYFHNMDKNIKNKKLYLELKEETISNFKYFI